jgi:hypothetical protein
MSAIRPLSPFQQFGGSHFGAFQLPIRIDRTISLVMNGKNNHFIGQDISAAVHLDYYPLGFH